MRTTVRVEGLRELDRALGELPKSTARNVLVRTLKKAGEPIDRAWRQNAPRHTGGLAESGDVGTKLSKRQRSLNRKQSFVEVYVGPGPDPAAITQEFGTFKEPAQPFLRPAYDGNKMKALDIVKDELGAEIMKAATRLARKQARLIAKNGG